MKVWRLLQSFLDRILSMIFNPAPSCSACICAALMILAVSLNVSVAADKVRGTLVHKNRTVTLRYAYLIKGPDAIGTKTIIRRLILSEEDIGARIQSCKTMSCVDGEVINGLIVDLISGPRLAYWMAINDGRVQHSGTLRPTVLKAHVDEAKRLAGKLSFDDTSAAGPRVEADFDALIFKEFTTAR